MWAVLAEQHAPYIKFLLKKDQPGRNQMYQSYRVANAATICHNDELSLSFLDLRLFTSVFSDKVLPITQKLSEWEYEKFWEGVGICNQSSQFKLKLKTSLAESFAMSFTDTSIITSKCLSENCSFLAHCCFSVIWNISQINV